MSNLYSFPNLRLVRGAALSASLTVLLAGCAGTQVASGVKSRTAGVSDRISEQTEAMSKQVKASRELVQVMRSPFVSRSTQPVAPEVALPAALRKDVNTTLMFPGSGITLSDFATRITKATGIPTRINPDVYLTPNQLVPGAKAGAASITAAPAGGAGGMTPGGASAASLQPPSALTVEIPANYHGPLPTLLQIVSERIGINHRYNDQGVLEFYRMVTRHYTIATSPGNADYTSSMGQTASGNPANFSSTSSLTTSTKLDPSGRLVATIRAMQTQAGTDPVFNDATGTLVVTDTAQVIDRISAFLDREKLMLTRQVFFEIQTLKIRSSRTGETGFDLSALYNQISSKYGITLTGVPSGSSTSSGSVSLGVLNGNKLFSGSQAFIHELATNGTSFTSRTQTLGTTNRTPAMYALTNSQDVVSKTTAQGGSVSGTVALGVETKTNTYGQILSLTPTVFSEKTMYVDVVISDSNQAAPPQPYAVGQGNSQVSVQLTSAITEALRERRIASDGQTLVLTGVESAEEDESRRGANDSASIALTGGRVAGNTSSYRTVILITARMADAQ